MSTETGTTVSLNINLLVRVDVEKAYLLGVEIAKETNALFLGIFPWNIANKDVEYFSFITEIEVANKIINKLKSNLKLLDENLSYTITPAVRPVQKPPPNAMAT